MTSRFLYAVLGILAALLGTAAGHLSAALLEPRSSPVLAVGSAVIDLTPTPAKEWAVRELGTADKPVLLGSVLVGVLVLAAGAGLLARHRLWLGATALAVLVAIAALAALTRPGAGPLEAVPALVAALSAVAALGWLVREARVAAPAEAAPGLDAAPGRGPRRRGLLLAVGVVAVTGGALAGAGRWVAGYRLRPVDVALPAAADPAPALPAGLEDSVEGVTAWRTPTEEFYRVDTRLDVPLVDPDDWRLTIDGDVAHQVTLSFDELLAADLVERDITLTCVSNEVGGTYVGGARWRGVLLADLLARAGVGGRADQILSTDVDGMTISTPLDLATDGRDSMVAIGMNGSALPREHGFPARLVVPGLYGFVGATKWLRRLTLTTYAETTAYWTDRDWATDAPIKIASRIDTPKPFADLEAGRAVVGGIAWAQQRGGVAAVEVRVDGGGWQRARLGPSAGQDYWRQWYLPWTATPGSHRLAVRAVSGDGETQTAVRASPFPDGSSGVQEVVVTVG